MQIEFKKSAFFNISLKKIMIIEIYYYVLKIIIVTHSVLLSIRNKILITTLLKKVVSVNTYETINSAKLDFNYS